MQAIKNGLRSWWNTVQFPIAAHDDIASASPTADDWTLRQERIATLTLALACAVVLLPNLTYPLIAPDETRYAQIALEMNQSRDWITPTLDGKSYLDKPPLMYWLTATSFSIFGTSEFAARFPSVISALATIGITFGLGRRLVGSRGAWLGSIALLLSGGFVIAGRFLILDSLLAFLIVASLLTGYIAVRERHHRWAWWMISGIACALGVLTKGPIALVLCAPPLIVSGWLRRDQTRTRLLHWIAFVIPMFVVCVPWYIAVWKFNPQFGEYFFLEHNLNRFTKGSNHQQAFWFYLPTLFAGMFPSSLLLPSLGVFLVSRSRHKQRLRSKDLGFLFCSSVWILLFFSLASCKLPTYILPAIPLICLMLGGMLDHTVFKPELPNRITAYLKPFPQRATLILMFACLAVVAVDLWMRGTLQATTTLAMVCCVVVTTITFVIWNRPFAFSPAGWGLTAAVAVGVLAFTSSCFIPMAASERSLYSKTLTQAQQCPDASIVFFGKKPHGVELQLAAHRVMYFERDWQDEFVGFVSERGKSLVVSNDEAIESTRLLLSQTHDLISVADDKHLYWAEPKTQSPRVGELDGRERR